MACSGQEDYEMSNEWTREQAGNFLDAMFTQAGEEEHSQFNYDWKCEQDVKKIMVAATMEASMYSSQTGQKWFTRTLWLKQAANAVQKHTGEKVSMNFIVNAVQRQQEKTLELHQTSNGHTTVRLIGGNVWTEAAEETFEKKSRNPCWGPNNTVIELKGNWTGAADAYPEGPEDDMAAAELEKFENYEPSMSSRAQSALAPKAGAKGGKQSSAPQKGKGKGRKP